MRQRQGELGRFWGGSRFVFSLSIVLLPKEFLFMKWEEKRKRKRVSFCLPHPSFETSQDLQEKRERETHRCFLCIENWHLFLPPCHDERTESQDESLSSLKRSSWSRRVCPSLSLTHFSPKFLVSLFFSVLSRPSFPPSKCQFCEMGKLFNIVFSCQSSLLFLFFVFILRRTQRTLTVHVCVWKSVTLHSFPQCTHTPSFTDGQF